VPQNTKQNKTPTKQCSG